MLKYQQIAKELFFYIKNNHLQQGDQLPSLTELAVHHHASKATILKALDELERDGFIYQVQGSGTFVRSLPKDDYINFNMSHGWTSDFTQQPTKNADVSVQEILPSVDIAKQLHCSVDTPVFKVQRVKLRHDKIFCFETSYYNSTLVPFLNTEMATSSLFKYIKQAYKISVGFSDKYFNVRELTDIETQKLGLPAKSFGLSVHESFYSTSGEIFDYSENVYHHENAKFYL